MDNLEITYAKNEIKGKGDMIATLMAWLNTPKGKYRESSLSATSLSVVLTLVRFIINSTKI